MAVAKSLPGKTPVRLLFILSPVLALMALLAVGYIANTTLDRVTKASEVALNDAMSRGLKASEHLSLLRDANLRLYETIAFTAAESGTLDVSTRIDGIERDIATLIDDFRELAELVSDDEQKGLLNQAIDDLVTQKQAMIFVGGMLEIDFAAVISFIEPFGEHLDRIEVVLNDVTMTEVERAASTLARTTETANYFTHAQTTLLGASILIVITVTVFGSRIFSNAMTTIERVTAELSLSKARLLDVINECPLLLLVVEGDGTIRNASAFAAAVFSYRQDELIGKKIADLMADPEQSIIEDVLASSDRRAHTSTVEMVRRDGTAIWSRQSARRLSIDNEADCVLLVCEDITRMKAMSDKLAYQARYDLMTGFLKREPFAEELQAVLDARTEGLAVCFVDVDRFKLVNDLHGHAAGDQVLIDLSKSLKSALSDKDLCARWGGDEFAILMRCDNERDMTLRAEKIRTAVADTAFECDGKPLDVTISVGVCVVDKDARLADDVLAKADSSCYAAKSSGRNAVCLSTDTEEKSLGREAQVLQLVEKCIVEDTLEILVQPFAHLKAETQSRCSGYEILTRIVAPDDTLITPDVFLPLLERFDMMHSFDLAVLGRVIALLDEVGEGNRPDRCFVNISRRSFRQRDFERDLLRLLSKYRGRSTKIVVELTELGFNDDLETMKRIVDEIHAVGAEVAIDDFGRGQSTLLSLSQLDADYVKLDGSLISNVKEDHRNLAIVKASVAMGHQLGCRIVAEWVEDEDTFALMKEIGVDFVQGFHYARPVPFAEFQPKPQNLGSNVVKLTAA